MPPFDVRDLGDYIRQQREGAKVSVRQLSKLAGVSNPYLSQIERGLRRPSAEILQQIAKALRISAETLYVQAGILDERTSDAAVLAAILADAALTERQKQVLVEIYDSFRRENEAKQAVEAAQAAAADEGVPAKLLGTDAAVGLAGEVLDPPPATAPAPTSTPAATAATARRSATGASAAARPRRATKPASGTAAPATTETTAPTTRKRSTS